MLTVENGSGLSDAESYLSVPEADSYHSARGNAAWSELETEVKEQALRKATDYMLQSYAGRWRGSRLKSSQALDWPRQLVERNDTVSLEYVESNIVPSEVKKATAELALRSITGELNPDIERATSSETVGSLSVSYFPGQSQSPTYKSIDQSLRGYLNGGSAGSVRIFRA